MRGYAVSNIAWPFADRNEAYALLAAQGVAGLEIAPALLFADAGDAFAPSDSILRDRLAEMRAAGLAPVSMQSLLFGVKDVALFGPQDQRAGYLAALKRAARLAGRLGIPHLVLGSPRERVIPPGMTAELAARIAGEVLAELADEAARNNCRIGLEPNPEAYGTNFATTSDEVAAIVRAVGHPALCMTLDIGGMTLNAEIPDLEKVITRNIAIIGHVHLSEPELAPIGEGTDTIARVIAGLAANGYAGWASIEMRAAGARSLDNLRDALGTLGAARAAAA